MRQIILKIVHRPVTIIMVILASMIFGGISLRKLDVGLMPAIKKPGLSIVMRYPDIAPDKIEEIAIIPVERSVSSVRAIKEIFCEAKRGEGRVHLLFDPETDLMERFMEVSEIVNRIKGDFPREMEEPSIIPYDPSNKPVMILSFEKENMSVNELRPLMEKKIKPSLEKINGVSEVFLAGGAIEEIAIQANPGLLVSSSLPVAGIENSISNVNYITLTGYIEDRRKTEILFDHKVHNWNDMNEEYVVGENLLKLHSVALVQKKMKKNDSYSRIDGRSKVTVYVFKSGIANTIQISQDVRRFVRENKKDFKSSDILYDQGEDIQSAINHILFDLLLGAVLSVMLIYLFGRGYKTSLLIISVMPITLLSSMFVLYMIKVNINVMSLSGLTIASGMTVDSTIVIVERVLTGFREKKKLGYYELIVETVETMSSPLIASTLVQVVVFLPLFYMEYEVREMLKDFAIAMISVMLLSLVFSLLIAPVLLNNYIQPKTGNQQSFKIQIYFESIISKAIHYFGLMGEYAVNRSGRVKIGMALVVIAGVTAFTFMEKGLMTSMPSIQIEGEVTYEPGLTLEKADNIVRTIEKDLNEKWFVKRITSNVKKDSATVNIEVTEDAIKSYGFEKLRELLDKESINYNNVLVNWVETGEMTDEQSISIDFYNEDLNYLRKEIQEIARELQEQNRFIRRILYRYRDPRVDLVLDPDNDAMMRSGISAEDYGRILKTLHRGSVVDKYYDGEKELDLRVFGIGYDSPTPEDVRNEFIPVGKNMLSNSEMLTISRSNGESNIYRKNKRRSLSIEVQIQDYPLVSAAGVIEKTLSSKLGASSFGYSIDDRIERIGKMKMQMTLAIILAVTIEYLVLGFLFNSFIKPIMVMSIVPVVLSTSLILIAIFQMKITVGVYFGLMMLTGFVVNSSVLILNSIEDHMKKNGNKLMEAVRSGIVDRGQPILMSVFTSILGMLPLVIDTSRESLLWRPLAFTVIIGLLISTIVMFLIVPAFFSYRKT